MNLGVAFYLRILSGLLVASSIFVIYYNTIVLRNYEIITNPDGPELEDDEVDVSLQQYE